MKAAFRWALLLTTLLSVSSCAKFPANGATQYTQIKFTVTMGGPIKPNYAYYVALYASTDPNPLPSSSTPVPVLTTGDPNGWLTGQATQYVWLQPSLGQPFSIWNVGNQTDPDANNQVIRNLDDTISLDSTGNYPSTFTFTIYTSDLTNASLAQTLQSLTFQIVAMNKLAIGSTSGRVTDALGPNTSFSAAKIPLNTSGTYANSSYFNNLEPANDTVGGYDPAIDIVDFSVQVIRP